MIKKYKTMNNQAFSKIWIIVVLVVFLVGGIFAWQYLKEPAEEIIVEETADWKIYKNEEYGFEMTYPEEWVAMAPTKNLEGDSCKNNPQNEQITIFARDILDQCGFLVHSIPPGNADVTIWVFDQVFEDIGTILEPPTENIAIDGELAVMYRFSFQQARPNVNATRIYFNHRERGYLIFLKNQNEEGTSYDPLYDQILSTFRFLEPAGSLDWRTYVYKEYGFEVKYPNGWVATRIMREVEIKNSQTGSTFSIVKNSNPESLSLDEWFSQATIVNGRPTVKAGAKPIIINGIKAYRINSELLPPNPYFEIVAIADSQRNILSIYTQYMTAEDGKILDQMLSTFRFLE